MFEGYKTHHIASELQRKCCNGRSNVREEEERVRKSVQVERERAPAKAGFAQAAAEAETDKHLHACKHKPPPTTKDNTIHSLTHTHFLLPAMRVKSADAAVGVAVAVAVAAGVAAHTVRMNEA